MFGPSGVFDPATYEPRSGKTFWMGSMPFCVERPCLISLMPG